MRMSAYIENIRLSRIVEHGRAQDISSTRYLGRLKHTGRDHMCLDFDGPKPFI